MAKIFNQSDRNPVGMIVSSMLTLTQFQTINGIGWVMADGTSIVGTKYAAVTGLAVSPDLRGMVMRGKNNSRADGNQNPDGDVAVGTFQTDALQGHFHNARTRGLAGVGNGTSSIPSPGDSNTAAVTGGSTVLDAIADGTNGTPRMAAESRMKNVTVNHFIKVND